MRVKFLADANFDLVILVAAKRRELTFDMRQQGIHVFLEGHIKYQPFFSRFWIFLQA